MNYKIVRKKETPNIWEFFENGKLLITIDEEKETSTGKGLLTIHKTFNRRPEEIDISYEILAKKEVRRNTKEEREFLRAQFKSRDMHFVDAIKIRDALLEYFCQRNPSWFSKG